MPAQEGYWGLLQGFQHRRRGLFDVSQIPDLHGKNALVTGANSGIGKWVCLELAKRGARVFLACRSKAKADTAISWIRNDVPEAELEFVVYNASSLQAVHKTAIDFLAQEIPLHIIVLNAGVIATDLQGSEDGIELMFAVNHLAHFALTLGLIPVIEKTARSAEVRIVVTTSAGFNLHSDLSSLHIEDRDIDVKSSTVWFAGAMPMYGRSKTASILFTSELSRLIRQFAWGERVRVNACHPGTISTGLNSSMRTSWYFYLLESVVYALASIPVDQGALALLYAATAEEVRQNDITGKYLTPYGFVNDAPNGTAAGSARLATTLWERSTSICKNHISGFNAFSESLT